jgi:hypothetical protein
MIRRVLTFVLLAFVALIVLKIALGLLGLAIGIAVTILVLAALGYALYLLIALVSPSTAARIRDVIRGHSTAQQSAESKERSDER